MSEPDAVLHTFQIGKKRMHAYDQAGSEAALIIARELMLDSYGLRRMEFEADDCVLDIGGHIGLFAMALAMRFPEIRIYSYEPHPPNFELFARNLEMNGIDNVRLYPEGVSGDGRAIAMASNPTNSGGATAHSLTLDHARVSGIPTMTIDRMLERDGIARCKLLKIDCEGAEYEALGATQCWGRVERMCGEFHSNALLKRRGHSPDGLLGYCKARLGADRVTASFCEMSE